MFEQVEEWKLEEHTSPSIASRVDWTPMTGVSVRYCTSHLDVCCGAGEGAGVAQAGGCWESAHKTKDGERTDTSFSQQSLAAPAPLGHVALVLLRCEEDWGRSVHKDAEKTSFV